MPGKNSPTKQRRTKVWKSTTYATGAERSLLIGLRIVEELDLSFDEAAQFLKEFANEIKRRKVQQDTEQLSLDHCAAAALQKLNQQVPV